MKRRISTIIWLAIAFAALALLAWQTHRDEETFDAFKHAISSIDRSWALAALLVFAIPQAGLAARWVVLLNVHGIGVSLFSAMKLTFLGLFYNQMMPGAVGGDLLKAWYITHHSRRGLRLEAAVTVFVDRLVGLIGMVILAFIATFFAGPEISQRHPQLRYIVWVTFAIMALLSLVFLSRTLRRILQLDRVARKLPFAARLRQIDQAIQLYRHHPGPIIHALLLTALMQGGQIVAIWMLARALGFDMVTLRQCLIIIPIVWVIGAAIPVPGGLGIIEGSVSFLFRMVINPENPADAIGQATALALLLRLMMCVSSLPGALVPIFGGHLPKRTELEHDMGEQPGVIQEHDQNE